MYKRTLFIFCVTVAAALASATVSPPEIDKHGAFEVDCQACHRDKLGAAPSQAECIGCHGSFEEMAEITKKYERNPHIIHEPDDKDFKCFDCHAMHMESYNFCEICHDVPYTVP